MRSGFPALYKWSELGIQLGTSDGWRVINGPTMRLGQHVPFHQNILVGMSAHRTEEGRIGLLD